MKKVLVVLFAMVFAIGMAMSAQAANVVNCKTTSEAIQKIGCEKAGSMSFSFDSGSVINEGDWWYADLPVGVTICKKIDYEITNGAVNTNFQTEPSIGDGLDLVKGTTVVIKDLGGIAGATGITGVLNGIKFRVQGNIGSQRMLITALDEVDAVGGSAITVDADAAFIIKILDGNQNATWMWKDDPTVAGIVYDTALDLPVTASVDNTFCINAQSLAGNLVNVSYDSRLDVFTFTGDNEVAHVVSANAIICEACKGATTGNVPIVSGQLATCVIDYDRFPGGPTGYCPGFNGNEFIISAVNALDDGEYSLILTITSPATGVYWGTGAASIFANDSADSTCPNAGGTAVWGGGFGGFLADGVTAIGAFPSSNCTTPAAGDMARVLRTVATENILSAQGIRKIEIDNLPFLVYDPAVVVAGQVVTIKLELIKEPCGKIFECSRDIATFVASCAAAAGVQYVMPYFPALSETNWWQGAAICNTTGAAIDVTFNLYEKDGDCATFVTSVPAYSLFNGLWSDEITNFTPCAANTGTIGDSKFFVVVNPGATGTFGFYMMGDGYQSMGTAVGPGCP